MMIMMGTVMVTWWWYDNVDVRAYGLTWSDVGDLGDSMVCQQCLNVANVQWYYSMAYSAND